jgi:polysaccharide biosynthesis protein PslG
MGKTVSWCLVCLFMLTARSPGQITLKFFGMHINHREEHGWPDFPFGTYRLWDSKTNWYQINPQKGTYDWTVLDRRLKDAQEHGVDVVYTFGKTPRWASSLPDDRQTCLESAGSCGPPSDLKEDGTGPDQYWKDFVTAIAKHAAGRIQFWELWNEPFNAGYWKGTFAQMVRMAKDAREIIKSIDPNATVLTPSGGLKVDRAKVWFRQYLAAGGGQYADGIAFHAYVEHPEKIASFMSEFKQILTENGQSSKPMFDTEGSWGDTAAITDPTSVISRLLILQASEGVSRVVWYSWDNRKLGNLWTPEEGSKPAAKTYQLLQDWLIGATFDGPCQPKEDIWTCDLRKNDGAYRARIVWSSKPEANATYSVPEGYVNQRDLSGSTTPLKGRNITISNRPVLLERPGAK